MHLRHSHIYLFLSGRDSLSYHLIGAGIFIASTFVNRVSTARCLDTMNKAVANNIPVVHHESNPELQGVTTSREFNFHPKTLLMDLVGTTSSIIPNLAVIFSTHKFLASLGNLRVAKRYNRAIQIANPAI